MKIEVKNHEPGISHVGLDGDLDFNTSPLIRKELAKLSDLKVQKVLLNLEKVSYIDSSGLATFIEFFQKTKRQGGKLVLYNLNTSVRSVFEIAKLDSIFNLATSQQEALAFFG